ncbi:hypothetical protein RJT34_12115 [Clitoria ternatea]|uniref:HTH myb-type domain-containing protein n=1 Tax=Clitoria ternatea TaxID=43366 RepID=A0AAN9JPS2_CLITE
MDNEIKNYWQNHIKKFLKHNDNNTTCGDDDGDELKSKAIECKEFEGPVTFVKALYQLMLRFDPEISKLVQRVLINPRNIDYHTRVFASKVDVALIATGKAPFTKGLRLKNICLSN